MAHTRHGNVDKLAYLRGYSWSATTTSRLPAPIRSETRAMPTDDRIRLDNRQRIASLGKQSIEANKYQPIKNAKGCVDESRAAHIAYPIMMMLHGVVMHRLLTKKQRPPGRAIAAACLEACMTLLESARQGK